LSGPRRKMYNNNTTKKGKTFLLLSSLGRWQKQVCIGVRNNNMLCSTVTGWWRNHTRWGESADSCRTWWLMMWNYASDGETRNRRLAHKHPSSILLILYNSDGSDICLKLYIIFFPLEYIFKKKKNFSFKWIPGRNNTFLDFVFLPFLGGGLTRVYWRPHV
jgi:hypothetical protein